MKRVLLVALAMFGCKASGGSADAGPATEVLTTAPFPPPSNANANFKVGDPVMFVRDDVRLEPEAEVVGEARPGDAGTRVYELYVGSGRFAKRELVPDHSIFPAPWLRDPKAGDTFYEARFGDFKPSKCTVKATPPPKGSLDAMCEGETHSRAIERRKAVALFRAPRPDETIPVGEIVYFKKMYWAIVIGTQDDRLVIREAGFAARSKAVLRSSIELVH